jgi:hypothetical protein
MAEAKLTNDALALSILNGFSRQELRDWVRSRLHGDDMGVSVDKRQDERPYSLIERVYGDLDRHIREDVCNLVADFVHDMACDPQSSWQGNAAHELLLLAQSVCNDTSVDDLIEMADNERFFLAGEQERGSDLHYRILQTLLALGWGGPLEFWQRQVRLSPDRYIGVAFNALAPTHLKEAIDLLIAVTWTAEVEQRVLRSLPTWIDKHRHVGITELLAKALPQMSVQAQNAITGNLARRKVTLPPVAKLTRDLGRVKEFWRGHGGLQPRSLAFDGQQRLAA